MNCHGPGITFWGIGEGGDDKRKARIKISRDELTETRSYNDTKV